MTNSMFEHMSLGAFHEHWKQKRFALSKGNVFGRSYVDKALECCTIGRDLSDLGMHEEGWGILVVAVERTTLRASRLAEANRVILWGFMAFQT